MARFNAKRQTAEQKTVTTNHEGGVGYQTSDKLALVSILFTSFLQNQFYRTADETSDQLRELIGKVDPIFAAKAAIFARDRFGMRTITHLAAGELTKNVKGQAWVKNFIDRVIVRPDDAIEIVAYLKSLGGPLPNSLKRGVIKGLQKFDRYQIGKYKAETREFTLADTVNLVTGGGRGRPRGLQISEAVNDLLLGTLETPDTWETSLTRAGQEGTSKAVEWERLVLSGNIGQMALLKNLRNILNAAKEFDSERAEALVDAAVQLLTNDFRIVRSRILPFRYFTAYTLLQKEEGIVGLYGIGLSRKVFDGLNRAIDISAKNVVPHFDGKTLIAVDTSYSMTTGRVGGNEDRSVAEVAALLAIMFAKANPNVRIVTFDTTARDFVADLGDTTLSLTKQMVSQMQGGGTVIGTVFELVGQEKFDRILFLSDFQTWDNRMWGGTGRVSDYRSLLQQMGNPFVYTWDLQGYGTITFPENKVATLAGYSEKVFEFMKLNEEDKNVMLREIEAIDIQTS